MIVFIYIFYRNRCVIGAGYYSKINLIIGSTIGVWSRKEESKNIVIATINIFRIFFGSKNILKFYGIVLRNKIKFNTRSTRSHIINQCIQIIIPICSYSRAISTSVVIRIIRAIGCIYISRSKNDTFCHANIRAVATKKTISFSCIISSWANQHRIININPRLTFNTIFKTCT